jgi:thimet oligopeptidase
MKKISVFFAMAIFSYGSLQAQNTLTLHSAAPIKYSTLNAATVAEAVEQITKICDEKIQGIVNAGSKQTTANTLVAFDELSYELADLSSKLGFLSSTNKDDSTRDAAFAAADKLSLYISNVYLNEPLYKAIKKFAATKKATLSTSQKKFITDAVVSFEKNGMKLDAEGRAKLENTNKKLVELGNKFDRNLAESKDSLEFTSAGLQGLNAADIAGWKRGDDKYVVYVNGPNSINIAENADKADTRKAMLFAYNNRAYPKNLEVLDSLLYYRNMLAHQLGFSSYAAYSVVDKMAATPATVWAFENDLIKKLTPLVTNEVAALTKIKQANTGNSADTLYAWDYSYYLKKQLNSKYQLNTDEVKEYFEMNNTLQGMFGVYERLLGIKIKATTGVDTWESKVKTYEMWKDGKLTGRFYLDLYPRPNKYTHFACFPITQYNQSKGVLPSAALVCNFPEGNAGEPSLLKHNDVVTLFHEFGHLVHWLVCHPAITAQNAFGTKGDFVEAPSQFLENWCWEYDALKLFAKNYKTGQPIPFSLFTKMKQAQLVNAGMANTRQLYLGTTDFTYEDRYEETKTKGLMQVSKEKYALTQLPFPEGTHFICSFTHLNGYGANYYGYLWSKVYAQDMFSIFKKKGVMDKATGIRYRKEILEAGATRPEIKSVETFLGRKPNSDAFLESLGVKK